MSKESKRTTRKKARTVTATKDEANQPAKDAQKAPVAPKEAKKRAPKEDLVVFAFRLTASERDQIHKAAGAAKASRFVRALSIAAARGDEKAVSDIAKAVKTQLAS